MYIGIDIGGTQIRILGLDSLDKIIPNRIDFTHGNSFESDFEEIVSSLKSFGKEIQAIGIGIVGKLAPDKKTIEHARNLNSYANKSLVDMLSSEFHCPVFMDNDIVTAALGEYYFGNQVELPLTYIGWGTGIGGARLEMKDGKVYTEKLDWYEYFEEWEKLCGGRELQEKYSIPANQLDDNQWSVVMESFQKQLDLFVDKTNSKNVILGGGVAIKQKQRLLRMIGMIENLDKKIPHIVVSSLGEDSGLFGGIGLLKQKLTNL